MIVIYITLLFWCGCVVGLSSISIGAGPSLSISWSGGAGGIYLSMVRNLGIYVMSLAYLIQDMDEVDVIYTDLLGLSKIS